MDTSLTLEELTRKVAELEAALADSQAALENLALTDPVTNLWNRRHVEHEILRLCELAHERGGPISVMRVDVDRFKAVNGAHGDAVGDEVLVGVAERLREQTRIVDLIARIGGDEFLILLAAASAEDAEGLAGRVRAAIARSGISTRRGYVSITASVGVATGDGSDPDALLRQANAAVEAAKASGGDTVSTAADPCRSVSKAVEVVTQN